jgi:NADH dehydrogenase
MRGSALREQPHVVILGGGFAGLYAVRALRNAPIRITLIDRRNHHLFQPLLYQVATAALAAPDVAEPIRKVFRRQRNVTVLLAEASAIDLRNRRVLLEDGEITYDRLVVATGATHAYFGHDEWSRHAPGLKSIEDAFEIRRRVLLAFEAAEREDDPGEQRLWLTFVVVGAGPTGVELAGALREIAQRTLARDFRNFDPRDTRVILIEGADRVLPLFPQELSRKARMLLERRGVKVRTGDMVTGVDAAGVSLGDERIRARTVLWAAGVRASPLAESLGVELEEQGRVLVKPDLSVPGHPEVFVVGDLAAVKKNSEWVPGMAPAAIQEGRHAALNIRRSFEGKPSLPFQYKERGMLATIGRSTAVAAIGRFRFSGFLAWTLWLVVHIVWLIGFRNRLSVLFEWTWAYLTFQRSARVILDRSLGGHEPVSTPKDAPSRRAADRPKRAKTEESDSESG